jgi:hypothetical protein
VFRAPNNHLSYGSGFSAKRFFRRRLDVRLHAKRQAVDYIISCMKEAMVLSDRYDLLKFALARAPRDGLVLEFGVATGAFLRFLAGQTNRTVHGFDSFDGLPEDWNVPGRLHDQG